MTLIPGDGIGPELAACVKEVFRYNDPRLENMVPKYVLFFSVSGMQMYQLTLKRYWSGMGHVYVCACMSVCMYV